MIQKILSNKKLKFEYTSYIKQFIKYLKEYKYKTYEDGKLKELSLDDETIKHHIKMAFELSINNNSKKYISFIQLNHYEKVKFNNIYIMNDLNFDQIYSLIGSAVFDNNIAQIINNGYAGRLITFINTHNSDINIISSSLFDDQVWNIINENPHIGNTSLLELFHGKLNVLIDIINKGLYEGLKYTYENIIEGKSFIEEQLGLKKDGSISLEQFSMDFIQNIGNDVLNKLYYHRKFSDAQEFKKLFAIAKLGNYELIKDIVNYDIYDFTFKNISEEDMTKSLLETNINDYNKSELFLNKFLGVSRNDIHYLKLFINAINLIINIPEDFNQKYGSLIKLINQILVASDEELITISKTMDASKKDEYHRLIASCEKDGNDVLKQQFVSDLQTKNKQIIENSEKRNIITNDGKSVEVYELNGQPFTMLVHAIADNRLSINNAHVSEIVNNPNNWNNINDGNEHISTSLISEKYLINYGTPNKNDTIMLGFSQLPWDSLKFTDIMDTGIDRKATADTDYNMRNRLFKAKVNTITTVNDLMSKTIETNIRKPHASRLWNEVLISRTDINTNEKIRPNYIVCMDIINETSINAANYFNVPIYLIKQQYYPELPYVNPDIEQTPTLEQVTKSV